MIYFQGGERGMRIALRIIIIRELERKIILAMIVSMMRVLENIYIILFQGRKVCLG